MTSLDGHRQHRTSGTPRRRGTILVLVLVVLLVVALFTTGLTRLLVLSRKHQREADQQRQREWLAESAVQRAREALARQADYAGETWQIPGDPLGPGATGRAVIVVTAAEPPASGRRVQVRVYYPDSQAAYRSFSLERNILSPPVGASP